MSFKPEPLKAIEGIFLCFTNEEKEIIQGAFEDLGYEFTPDGIKDFILDSIEADNKESKPGAIDTLVGQVADAVKRNPDQVRAYASLAGSFVKNIMKGRSNRTPQR
jgi:hypothetical protein